MSEEKKLEEMTDHELMIEIATALQSVRGSMTFFVVLAIIVIIAELFIFFFSI